MFLQYFKKKENEYKIKSDKIYLNILEKSKTLLNKKYFTEINFNISFELISILLIYHLKFYNNKNMIAKKSINEKLMNNLVNDLDQSLRDVGIGDMSIGKYVKNYVKKFYYRLKILDPIFEKDNFDEFLIYINSLKFVNKCNSNEFVNELSVFFLQIKNDNE